MRPRLSSVWLLLLAATALRAPGMFHDFWFDEAWSFLLVRDLVTSPAAILTRLRVDNNHPLNSLFLHVLGAHAAGWVYRLPALAFGVGAVALAGRIMARRSRVAATIAMILVGGSYPLIVYSSEARGYAPMVFFVLLAIHAHERHVATRGATALVAFWIAVVLGFLSHLTFVHVYGAILLWAVHEARARRDGPGAVSALVVTQGVPLLFLAAFHLVYIRHLYVAGAEPAPFHSVLAETVAVMVGTAPRGIAVWGAFAVVIVVACAGLTAVRRADTGLFIFYASGIFVLPALGVVLAKSRPALIEPRFFPRYFLVSITLWLLLGAWWLAELFEKHAAGRAGVVAAVALYVLGNLWHTAHFIADGRGQYRKALDQMAAETRAPVITVSSNSDLRTGVLLAFHGRQLPGDTRVVLYPHTSARAAEATWHIREDLEPTSVPGEFAGLRGQRFRLRERYPFYGLSGCQWSVYERVDGPEPATTERSGRRGEPRR